jgi:hypothetical protein
MDAESGIAICGPMNIPGGWKKWPAFAESAGP